MMDRRRLLLLTAATALLPAWGWPRAWHRDVSELRFGASGGDAGSMALMLRSRLGVAVRALPLQGAALAQALDRGHVEFALLDRATLSMARARMGHRLMVHATPIGERFAVVRRVLPARMRADLVRALA